MAEFLCTINGLFAAAVITGAIFRLIPQFRNDKIFTLKIMLLGIACAILSIMLGQYLLACLLLVLSVTELYSLDSIEKRKQIKQIKARLKKIEKIFNNLEE